MGVWPPVERGGVCVGLWCDRSRPGGRTCLKTCIPLLRNCSASRRVVGG